MSAVNLDKSLDEIIGNSKQNNRARINKNRARNAPKKAAKQVNTARRSVNPKAKALVQRRAVAPAAALSRVSRFLDTSREARVNVEGLPRDIKQDAVREFFSSQVGGVSRVLLSYNERGQSTGMANVTFKSGDQAKKAVAKFNGAPIDGGRSRLRLNLIIDPTMKPVMPLNERIRALPQRPIRTRVPQNTRASQQGNGAGPAGAGPTAARKPAGANKKAAAAKARKQRKDKPVKKSLEDLDKEMADYFEESK